jgi:hypothetical protein
MSFVIDHRLEIAAPLDTAWAVLTDLPRYGEWNPFLPACRTTFKPGDPIDLTVQLMARPQAQREWVREFVPGQKFAYSMKPVPLGALSSYRSHEFRALDAGRTEYRSHFELRGWLMPLVRGLLRARLQAGFDGMSQGLKARAESLWAQDRPRA